MSSNDSPGADVYRAAILAEAPRVMGLMDREPFSPTRGCCDRVYWAWKFTDFPGARFQEALCVMGFLYATELEGGNYYHNPRLLDWIGNGLRYWSSIQYPDGSFDEAYPYERSLAATAFTTFYIGEALNFIGDSVPVDLRTQVRATMQRAGDWLCRNDESHGFLSNHLAAAAAALYHAFRETGDERYEARSRYFIECILAHQSSEGWYEEYGGADPGYQTHGSFYLARYLQLTGDRQLADSLDNATDFLARFVHADGSIGGEYASRNTQTYYPAAFEILAGQNAAAAWIASHMRPHLFSGNAADLRGVDAYNYFPCLNNAVFAYLACAGNTGASRPESSEPDASPGLAWYPKAGFARIRTTRYDAYIGTAKGGVLKVFDRLNKCLVHSDCGYLGKLQNGNIITTQHMDNVRDTDVRDDHIRISGKFYRISKPVMTPARFIGFRLFMLTAGRFPAFARWLKRYLVKVLVYRKQEMNIDFKREIEFTDTAITVTDMIVGPDGKLVNTMLRGERFTTIHMGSSRYFINNELSSNPGKGDEIVDCSQLTTGIKLVDNVLFAESGESDS